MTYHSLPKTSSCDIHGWLLITRWLHLLESFRGEEETLPMQRNHTAWRSRVLIKPQPPLVTTTLVLAQPDTLFGLRISCRGSLMGTLTVCFRERMCDRIILLFIPFSSLQFFIFFREFMGVGKVVWITYVAKFLMRGKKCALKCCKYNSA